MDSLIHLETFSTILRHSAPQSTSDLVSITAIGIALVAYTLKGTPWNRPDPYHNLWFERPQFKDGSQPNRPRASRNIAEILKQGVGLLVDVSKRRHAQVSDMRKALWGARTKRRKKHRAGWWTGRRRGRPHITFASRPASSPGYEIYVVVGQLLVGGRGAAG